MKVLGIDSGLERTGYAIIQNNHRNPYIITSGCIITDKTDSHSIRIKVLGERLEHIINQYHPDVVVVEKIFFNSNQKTAISVAQAQGVTMYIAAHNGCNVHFLTPLEIKQTITGYGRADKKNIEKMLKIILDIEKLPKPDDVTDAIACGLAFATISHLKSQLENTL